MENILKPFLIMCLLYFSQEKKKSQATHTHRHKKYVNTRKLFVLDDPKICANFRLNQMHAKAYFMAKYTSIAEISNAQIEN